MKDLGATNYILGIIGLDKSLSCPVAPCGKKTTSGRMLGCVIFFP